MDRVLRATSQPLPFIRPPRLSVCASSANDANFFGSKHASILTPRVVLEKKLDLLARLQGVISLHVQVGEEGEHVGRSRVRSQGTPSFVFAPRNDDARYPLHGARLLDALNPNLMRAAGPFTRKSFKERSVADVTSAGKPFISLA